MASAKIVSAAAVVGFAWGCFARAAHTGDAANQHAAFSLLLVTAVWASAIAWGHYLVFLIFPLLSLSTEFKLATGRKRLWNGFLVVVSLLVFNSADSRVAPATLGGLGQLIDNAPVFALGVLYFHFARLVCRKS